MASMACRITLCCCIAFMLAAGALAYPKELIGTWVGTCQQVASSNLTGMNSICTGSPKVLAIYPYMITYSVMKSKTIKGGMDMLYAWSVDATVVDIMMDGEKSMLYSPALTQNMTYALAHGSPCGPGMYCITSRPAGVGPIAYLASVSMVGSRMVYMEQGTYSTYTSMPSKTCPMVDNMPMYCDEDTFNYICTAFKLPKMRR